MLKVHPLFDAARLLHDLQRVNEIAQSFSGQLDPDQIASQVTGALVQTFGCAFARIWLVEPDQTALRLVASSGLYTHLDGAFAKVPMGAYKVGKIAQNRVPFLSNQLSEEAWVKDRQWAIANQIQGFAGYPLIANDRVIGVVACFSQSRFDPEFLEVLQVLCMAVTIALDTALQVKSQGQPPPLGGSVTSLSDRMARTLGMSTLTLMGPERSLRPALRCLLLQAAETLKHLGCSYCRLTYTPNEVALAAITTPPKGADTSAANGLISGGWGTDLHDLQPLIACFGGTLQSQPVMQNAALQIMLTLPTEPEPASELSARERQVMQRLAEGQRDREIAHDLFISESTVKFHINNSLAKLKAKNRYQGVYQAVIRGWI
ncbi:MAG: GAF domain-containing protein [Leptolyngbyaceae cyanobacterium]